MVSQRKPISNRKAYCSLNSYDSNGPCFISSVMFFFLNEAVFSVLNEAVSIKLFIKVLNEHLNLMDVYLLSLSTVMFSYAG